MVKYIWYTEHLEVLKQSNESIARLMIIAVIVSCLVLTGRSGLILFKLSELIHTELLNVLHRHSNIV